MFGEDNYALKNGEVAVESGIVKSEEVGPLFDKANKIVAITVWRVLDCRVSEVGRRSSGANNRT